MTEHPSNDLDDVLRSAAQDYNRPGETPRDRLWESIRAERARRATPMRRAERRRLWVPALAAAAVLVLGIALGRVYEHMTGARANTAVASVSRSSDSPQTKTAAVDSVPVIASVRPESEVVSPSTRQAAPETPRATRRAFPRPTPGESAPTAPETTNLALRLAVVEHFAGTEAMLTSFRAEAARGQVDAQITTWARNLLTTTRLLQGSAAQQDPTLKRLLDDLELVLLQIAQYTSAGAHHAEELELIEHSIERRGVIGKLRTNIPARLAPSGT